MPKATPQSLKRARRFRRKLTKPEIMLWQELRHRPGKLKFRRQHPIGPYILDFYCASAKLAVEIDGQAHDMGEHPARDTKRDDWLASNGIETLRIPAQVVLRNRYEALAIIMDTIGQRQR